MHIGLYLKHSNSVVLTCSPRDKHLSCHTFEAPGIIIISAVLRSGCQMMPVSMQVARIHAFLGPSVRTGGCHSVGALDHGLSILHCVSRIAAGS